MKENQATKGNRTACMLALACLALTLAGYAPQSLAQCVMGPGVDKNVITLNFGLVIARLDAPVSQTEPIATKKFLIQHQGDTLLDCRRSSKDGFMRGSIHKGTHIGTEQIFRTNIPGIGIRIGFRVWDSIGTYRFPTTFETIPAGSWGTYSRPEWVIHAELFKIAKTTGNGPLEAGLYATMYSADAPQQALQVLITGRSATISTPSCTAPKTTSVQLGKVWKNLLSSVGSTAAEQSFNITLNCREAKPELNVVYLKMDAKPAASGAPGVIALTPDADAATGVGIQILDKDRNPVVYGQQALVGVSKNGVYTVPFHARYYQTENKVTAGVANGTATFTLEYK